MCVCWFVLPAGVINHMNNNSGVMYGVIRLVGAVGLILSFRFFLFSAKGGKRIFILHFSVTRLSGKQK